LLGSHGPKLGGKLSDNKGVLCQRLAHWLNKVLEAGREAQPQQGECDTADFDGSGNENSAESKPQSSKQILFEYTGGAAEVPPDALVTSEQAESALGHVQATDFDADIFEALDEDQKEEEMALMGRHVNPPGIDYDCIAWSPVSGSDLA
jgi:hypothetical protein